MLQNKVLGGEKVYDRIPQVGQDLDVMLPGILHERIGRLVLEAFADGRVVQELLVPEPIMDAGLQPARPGVMVASTIWTRM